jgi:hypothetical protein
MRIKREKRNSDTYSNMSTNETFSDEEDSAKKNVKMTPEERRDKVRKFLEKRRAKRSEKPFDKGPRYSKKSAAAKKKARLKGRFVRDIRDTFATPTVMI